MASLGSHRGRFRSGAAAFPKLRDAAPAISGTEARYVRCLGLYVRGASRGRCSISPRWRWRPISTCLRFHFHIPYSNQFGHRGAAHSLVVAVAASATALLGAVARFPLRLEIEDDRLVDRDRCSPNAVCSTRSPTAASASRSSGRLPHIDTSRRGGRSASRRSAPHARMARAVRAAGRVDLLAAALALRASWPRRRPALAC